MRSFFVTVDGTRYIALARSSCLAIMDAQQAFPAARCFAAKPTHTRHA